MKWTLIQLFLLQAQNIQEAYKACDEVLEVDDKNIEALCDRAEVYIADEKFEEGQFCFSSDKLCIFQTLPHG